MPAAAEFHKVCDGLFVWQAYDPSVKTELTSCALRLSRGLIFIDPISLAKAALAELSADSAPLAVIITNANHARAAGEFRQHFSIPIYAHSDAAAEFDFQTDERVADGERLFAELDVIALPGAVAGEIALHSPAALHLGDALIHLPRHGFAPLPEKYCADGKAMRAALGKLLRFEFGILTFAHGLPIVAKARRRLAQLLA